MTCAAGTAPLGNKPGTGMVEPSELNFGERQFDKDDLATQS